MTAAELEENLGTIAHSGSGKFLAELAEAAKKDVKLIGKFGVGFYSAFMAAKVQSRSWDGSQGSEWFSDGNGTYTITPCDGLHRGTKIIMELKEDAHEYAEKFTIEQIIKQYSAVVSFPVKVEAIWLRWLLCSEPISKKNEAK